MAADGLITIRSAHGPQETMNRLEAQIKAKGMTVFARVDNAAGAAAVGLNSEADRRGQGRHTAYAIGSDERDRLAVKDARLAGRLGRRPAFA